jgi:N-acetylmuramoyl-L-alanine amidase CwlA
MNQTRIIVHNTANDASARNEVKYMQNNKSQTSFHYAVDDKEVIQALPLNRNSWNAGDGRTGKGNREGISIEICYSKSGGSSFILAEKRAAKLIAEILDQKGWDISKVTKHQDYSGKYCPHRTLDMGWNRFLKMIEAERKTSFKVRVTADSLNCRAGAGVQYKINGVIKDQGVYTIIDKKNGWGKLKSGAGWINLKYTKSV